MCAELMPLVKVLHRGMIPMTFSLTDLQCGHTCAVIRIRLSPEKQD